MSDGFDNIIDLDSIRQILDAILPMPSDIEAESEEPDNTRSPPMVTDDMFPGILGDIVGACSRHCEAVPVAVSINTLIYFSALVGPMVHLPIGDENRLLNDFALMVGPSGLGKGASNHGPRRIFNRVEEFLALDLDRQFQEGSSNGIKQYSPLRVHNGGLSSGEGLAAALDDGEGEGKTVSVTDKRTLVFESEFANSMNMSQRSGNILMMVLRNAYDGVTIQPLTKRDRVKVSDPYVCLIAHITARELAEHDQFQTLANNGMLNRFLILWQQPDREVPFPSPVDQGVVDHMANLLAERILFARRNSHETHWKKIRSQSLAITFSQDAITLWESEYGKLLNRADCDVVKVLTRRHRLHALILASLFAFMDLRSEIRTADIKSALAWCEYSRQSVVYIFNTLSDQRKAIQIYGLSRKVLFAVYRLNDKNNQCTKTDIHNWFSRKLKSEQLQASLECLMHHIPPMVEQHTIKNNNDRTVPTYRLTKAALGQINDSLKGGLT